MTKGLKALLDKYANIIEDYDREYNYHFDTDRLCQDYWVYLKKHYISELGCGSHTIHEFSIKRLKEELSRVVYVEEDLYY